MVVREKEWWMFTLNRRHPVKRETRIYSDLLLTIGKASIGL